MYVAIASSGHGEFGRGPLPRIKSGPLPETCTYVYVYSGHLLLLRGGLPSHTIYGAGHALAKMVLRQESSPDVDILSLDPSRVSRRAHPRRAATPRACARTCVGPG